MATKTKNSSDDPESKTNQLRAAAGKARGEFYSSLIQFRTGIDDALMAVESFVAEANRLSKELRTEQCDVEAEALAREAEELAKVTKRAFRNAATEIIDLIFLALLEGYPVHVLRMEPRLRGRDRARWGRLCARERRFLAIDPDDPFSILSHPDDFIDRLKRIDGRAGALSAEQVIEAAAGRATTTAGFAAKLACMCGAFDYNPEDQEKAQQAFKQAMTEGS